VNILVVSFVDDNFGDNLIRICFENILKVVLENHQINNYTINRMNLKNVDTDLIKQSDIIFFAGGGLFGLSYLNFYKYLASIIELANQCNIPVIFSSMGINNMSVNKENESQLIELLDNECIKAISVRENKQIFEKYAKHRNLVIKEVCDPVCWAQYIYKKNLKTKTNKIGINVVRGGLFKDNGIKWTLTNELNYLNDLKNKLDELEIDYMFYTNGNFLDNNTLLYFKKEYQIPEDKIFIPDTSKQLVEIISTFDKTISIRMHSAIISYALDIPSVTLKWNDKINLFYQNINRDKSCILVDQWNIDNVLETLMSIDECYKDENYLMSLYNYLYDLFNQLNLSHSHYPKYDFSTVTQLLINQNVDILEDDKDMHIRISKGQYHYLCRFIDLRKKNKEIKELNKQIEELNKKNKEINEKLENKNREIQNINQKIKEKDKEIKKLNDLKVVKIYKKIKGN
jgi:polysaccharide pyruvyl transferase WcaK-like protein